jgi:uncharacterized protein YggU (UPF0235/DUF167 family)
VRICIRVIPNAPRTVVGGARSDALIVRVQDRAVGGKATEAALRALATSLGVARGDVTLHSGATARDKLVDIPDAAVTRLHELRAAT